MGRSKSNTKRRPKGKRGWRKIDVASSSNPKVPLSLAEERNKIEKLRDSQLWNEDTTPRKSKKLTKKLLKARARRKLLHRGFKINSTNANNILNKKIKSYNKKQRFFTWKQSQNPNVNENSQPKQTAILKFKNKTKKKIQLNNHKNIIVNKKNIKNSIDYHKNNPYNSYKINSKHECMKDLWHNKNRKNKQTTIDNSSKTFNPIHIINNQKKAFKCHLTKGHSVQNKFVSYSNGISLPNPGESINPSQHEYYYLKWKTIQLKAKQIFINQYQKQSTLKWYKKNLSTDKHTDQTVEKLKQKANEMKKLYFEHLRLWRATQRENMDGMNDFEREISHEDKMCDFRGNKKMNDFRNKMRVSTKSGRLIYGSRYRFKRRVTPSMKSSKLGNCLRNTLHTGIDHPLSFMFNEMQKQNKIHGHRRNRFIFPKKKGFLGPRFKVQTRIGKLHHANVDNKYFSGIDDL